MKRLALVLIAALLAACSSAPPQPESEPAPAPDTEPAQPQRTIPRPPDIRDGRAYFSLVEPEHREQLVIASYNLLGTGYRFGGKNPEAGLDCSGMVSYLVEVVSGQRLPHNAARIARITRPIDRDALQAGDLVFFNTNGKPYSHMGIYVGDERFIHAPSSRGKVRVERMDNRYFARRFTAARTLVDYQ
ncbi:MAG: C40 family peptidase [Rhodocyclaceae bacterium]|nr:C40 family peptidase [Rhodocyclaceae bacterium]